MDINYITLYGSTLSINPGDPVPLNQNVVTFIDDLEIYSDCNSEVIVIASDPNYTCVNNEVTTVTIDYEVCLTGTVPADINLVVSLDQPGLVGNGIEFIGDFVTGEMDIMGLTNCQTVQLEMEITGLNLGDEFEVTLTSNPAPPACSGSQSEVITPVELKCFDCACPFDSEIIGTDDNSVSYLSNLIQNSTLPANPTTPLNIVLNGTLYIDQASGASGFSYSFPAGSKICMQQGAAIIVSHNRSLQITDSHISGCDYLWRSIYVFPGATLEVTGSKIEDGAFCVDVSDNSNVNLTDNEFDNNFVTVNITDDSSPSGFTYTGNIVKNTTDLLTPYSNFGMPSFSYPAAPASESWAAIYSETQTAITIGAGGTGMNHFDGISNGIIHKGFGDISILNTKFEDMKENDYDISGYGVYAENPYLSDVNITQEGFGKAGNASFIACDIGVYGNNVNLDVQKNRMIDLKIAGVIYELGTDEIVTIAENTIKDGEMGIIVRSNTLRDLLIDNNELSVANNGLGLLVEDLSILNTGTISRNDVLLQNSIASTGMFFGTANDASVLDNTVYMNASGTSPFGIGFNGCNNLTVNCNNVTGGGLGNGIGMEIFTTSNTVYSCNVVDNTSIGIQFNGACTGTTFQGNVFNTHNVGLHYSGFAGGVVTGEQAWRGNMWNDLSITTGAQHDGNFNSSIYKIEQTQIAAPNLWPPNPLPNMGWFIFESPTGNVFAGCDINCLEERPGGEGDGTVGGDGKGEGKDGQSGETDGGRLSAGALEKHIINNTLELDESMIAYSWITRKVLFSNIEKGYYDNLAQSSELDLFFNQNKHSTIGEFYRINRGLQALNASSSLSEYQNKAGTERKEQVEKQHDIAKRISENRERVIDELLANNQQVSTNTIFESNTQEVNDIYLRTVAKGNTDFTEEDYRALEFIADQCPYIGGDAVLKARSILNLKGFKYYDDRVICKVKEEQKQNSREYPLLTNLLIHPNPATSEINISLNAVTDSDGTMIIRNLFGEIYYNEIIAKDTKTLSLNVDALISGVYWLEIKLDSGAVLSGKFLIVK